MSEKIVLHLGDADSYSGQAARVLAEGYQAQSCDSFESIEVALRNGAARHAVVPVRNSLIGTIEGARRWEGGWVRTQDAVALLVEHRLAGRGSIDTVERVISHPAALAQCAGTLVRHRWSGVEAPSTSRAAAIVAQSDDQALAAICSKAAAEAHGLEILSRKIADKDGNETVFALIEVVGEA